MSEPPSLPARNGMAVAALILGIMALVLSLFVIGALLGLVAAVLGFLALRNPARRGSAIAGIITGVLAIPIAVMMFFLLFVVLGAARERARLAAAGTHVHQLETALVMYSAEYNDRLPQHLAYLQRELGDDARPLLDPRLHTPPLSLPPGVDWAKNQAEVEAHCDFWFAAAGLHATTARGASEFIWVYDKPGAGRERLIGFADGHVEFVRAHSPELTSRVAESNRQRAAMGLNPLPPQLQGPPPAIPTPAAPGPERGADLAPRF